jgi:hypothetical protein
MNFERSFPTLSYVVINVSEKLTVAYLAFTLKMETPISPETACSCKSEKLSLHFYHREDLISIKLNLISRVRIKIGPY